MLAFLQNSFLTPYGSWALRNSITTWLCGNWNDLLPSPWSSIALAVTAVFCGAIVGAEREKKGKPTGTRTLTLVCVGSAVFTMISFGPAAAINAAGVKTDVGRIAAQIVSGIGFLGAGVILRGRFGVAGLTSAATIWIMAATGMLVGTGYAVGGLALSLLILAILTVISAFEQRYFGPCKYGSVRVTYDCDGGKASIKIEEVLDAYYVSPERRKTEADAAAGRETLEINYCFAHPHHREFLSQLAEMPDVRQIRREIKE